MARQKIYEKNIQVTGMQAPQMARVMEAPEAGGALSGVFDGALDLGGKLVAALGKEYAAGETARADGMLLAADRRFEEWKQGYMETNRGQLGLNAREDFARAWDEIAGQAVKEFGGEGDEVFREMLARRLREHGGHAVREGGAWGRRQKSEWDASVWEGQIGQLERMIGADPWNGEAIAQEVENLKSSWLARNPGLDPTATYLKLEDMALEGRVNGLLALDEPEAAEAVAMGHGVAPRVDRRNFGGPVALGSEAAGLAAEMAKRHGLRPELVAAVMMQESGGRQEAVSAAGAKGLMQLMPGTAKELGVDADNPRENVEGGARYLRAMVDRYGDERIALLAYNWGPGNVDAWLKSGRGARGQSIPKEAREYADRVYARMGSHAGGGIYGGLGAPAGMVNYDVHEVSLLGFIWIYICPIYIEFQ